MRTKDCEGVAIAVATTLRGCSQFHYGEDGVDVMSVGYLRAFTFLARNAFRCVWTPQPDRDRSVAHGAPVSFARPADRV